MGTMIQGQATRQPDRTLPSGSSIAGWARRAGLLGACSAGPLLAFPSSEVPLGWLLVGAGYAIGCGAWVREAATAGRRSRPEPPRLTAWELVRASLFAYLATIAVFVFVTAPLLLFLWPIEPRLGILAVLVGLSIVPRTLLCLPALVAGDDAETALERAWAWTDVAPLRTSIVVAALLAVSIGPAIAVAAWAGEAGHAGVAQRLAALVMLVVTGGLLPSGLGPLVRDLDRRRRRMDPRFGRA